MIKASWCRYTLRFRFEARTSRDSMRLKDTWFVRLTDMESMRTGIGECALFRGLSAEDSPLYEARLAEVCRNFDPAALPRESSLRFGFETALESLRGDACDDFTAGRESIPINGLIWMGDKEEMRRRIDEKLDAGFHVLKLKIGGIDFDQETDLLRYIRSRYAPGTLELRLDANGSFSPDNALERLHTLSQFSIHSIEQPVRAGQHEAMARICRLSPIPIALDEELIGTRDPKEMSDMLDIIRPSYIILKPALCGGLSGASQWIGEARRRGIGWWATSALESNIGLAAIARWVSAAGVVMPQGLGTGQLYFNNIPSPLELRGDRLHYDPTDKWEIPDLPWQ